MWLLEKKKQPNNPRLQLEKLCSPVKFEVKAIHFKSLLLGRNHCFFFYCCILFYQPQSFRDLTCQSYA